VAPSVSHGGRAPVKPPVVTDTAASAPGPRVPASAHAMSTLANRMTRAPLDAQLSPFGWKG